MWEKRFTIAIHFRGSRPFVLITPGESVARQSIVAGRVWFSIIAYIMADWKQREADWKRHALLAPGCKFRILPFAKLFLRLEPS